MKTAPEIGQILYFWKISWAPSTKWKILIKIGWLGWLCIVSNTSSYCLNIVFFFFGQTKKNLEEGPRKMETERHQTVKNPVVVALQHRAPSHHLHLHPLPLRTTKLSLSHPPRSQVTPYVEGVGRWLLIPSRWRLNLIKVCGFTLIFSLSCRMFIRGTETLFGIMGGHYPCGLAGQATSCCLSTLNRTYMYLLSSTQWQDRTRVLAGPEIIMTLEAPLNPPALYADNTQTASTRSDEDFGSCRNKRLAANNNKSLGKVAAKTWPNQTPGGNHSKSYIDWKQRKMTPSRWRMGGKRFTMFID